MARDSFQSQQAWRRFPDSLVDATGLRMNTEDLLRPPNGERVRSLGRVGTLGMFIIDQFQVSNDEGEPVVLDEEVIGGGGVYAMTAARMFLPASSCALIVDKGEDVPKAFDERLRAMGEEMLWSRNCNGNSTRALNIYSGRRIGEGHQSFKYLSREAQISPNDFISPTSPFKGSLPEWIHVVCLVERAQAIALELDAIASGALGLAQHWRPNIVWEPLPGSCVPEKLDEVVAAAFRFAVFSPNALEIQSLLGRPADNHPSAIESAATAFGELLDNTSIIVRAGHLGSYTLSGSWTGWVPAYWREHEQDRVIDPTGGGNAFLGGLCAGLLLSSGDLKIGSIYGSAAASFAIQQRGLPELTNALWNNDDSWTRLRDIAARMRPA